MLNPVGLVDEGRVSQDTGHAFLRSKEAEPGIAARYYMHRNFFITDPDAFTVSRQLLEERSIQAPLTLNEAQVSIALAAVSGGMFEIGDDLPTLGSDPERLALVKNPDLLAMVKLGQAAVPLDLMTYTDKDEQPSVFLLRERAACLKAGITRESIVLDPGLGFGKGDEHNIALLKNLQHLAALGAPLLVGLSRKSLIGKVLGRPTLERLYGGLGLAAWAVSMGARVVRTHDVAATRDAIRMVSAVMEGTVN